MSQIDAARNWKLESGSVCFFLDHIDFGSDLEAFMDPRHLRSLKLLNMRVWPSSRSKDLIIWLDLVLLMSLSRAWTQEQ